MVQRYLIVNADDFGQSPGVNRGIIAACEHGIVTSASLMVRCVEAAQAAAYARQHPRLSVGLHVDLGEWVWRCGTWVSRYERVPTDDAAAVRAEVTRQLELFRHLTDRNPTHLDSHQHVHRREPIRSLLLELASDLAVPLRHFVEGLSFCGRFYGQTREGKPLPDAVTVPWLIDLLASLPWGITELGCHPGEEGDVDSVYRKARSHEVKALCDPRVRAALAAESIELCSFHDIPGRKK